MFREPVSASLRNMLTGEEKQFSINPKELEIVLNAQWNELDIKGMPNLPLRFQNVKNMRINFSLYFSRAYIQTQGKASFKTAKEFIIDYRAFLHSLLLPNNEENITGYQTAEPPKVWFRWQNVLSMPISIIGINWKIKSFALDLSSNQELADIKAIVNLPDVLWADEIRLTSWEIM